MANSSATRMVHIATVRSTPKEDKEPAVVYVNEFETQIKLFESQMAAACREAIKSEDVRAEYMRRIKAASDELIEMVRSRKITPHEGAISAYNLRNKILLTLRGDLTSFGLAYSRNIKPDSGRPFEYYLNKNSQELFNKPYQSLTTEQKERVLIKLVEKAGKSNSDVSVKAKFFGMAGRALLIVTLAVAVYNVIEAEDKERQALKEGATLGGGIAGGIAGGAAVFAIASNPAGWVVGLATLVGAALTGVGTSEVFDYFWPEKGRRE